MSILIPKATTLRPAGQTTLAHPDSTLQHDTLMCVHCQHHWRVEPGSGRVRGYCRSCMGVLCCTTPACMEPCERGSMHWEKRMETREKESQLLITPED